MAEIAENLGTVEPVHLGMPGFFGTGDFKVPELFPDSYRVAQIFLERNSERLGDLTDSAKIMGWRDEPATYVTFDGESPDLVFRSRSFGDLTFRSPTLSPVQGGIAATRRVLYTVNGQVEDEVLDLVYGVFDIKYFIEFSERFMSRREILDNSEGTGWVSLGPEYFPGHSR